MQLYKQKEKFWKWVMMTTENQKQTYDIHMRRDYEALFSIFLEH